MPYIVYLLYLFWILQQIIIIFSTSQIPKSIFELVFKLVIITEHKKFESAFKKLKKEIVFVKKKKMKCKKDKDKV